MSSTPSMRLRQLMLGAVFNQGAFTLPSSSFVALTYKVAPANASANVLAEPTTGGYARQEIPLDSDHWSISPFGELFNSQDVFFQTPSTEWGLLIGWALTDAPIGGDLLATGSLKIPTYFLAGQDPPAFAAGSLGIAFYD